MATRRLSFIVAAVCVLTTLAGPGVSLSAQGEVFDVWQSRQEFYRLLDARERELMKNLNYGRDGAVIRDGAYQKAFQEFSDYEQSLRDDFMSRRGRDDALVNVFDDAGFDADERNTLFKDSGSAPGERLSGADGRNRVDPAPITRQDTQTPYRDVPPKDAGSIPSSAIDRGQKDFYRGELGDRDVTAKSPEHVARIAESARKQGYKVIDNGDGYIRIKELDTIVWHEDSQAYRQYLEDKGAFRSRLSDPEYVAGGKDSGAVQQVSKVQNQFRPGQPPGSDLPDNMRTQVSTDDLSMKRAEFAQNLGKAGHKIDSALVQRGQPSVTTEDTREKFRRLTQGEDQRVVLSTFGEQDPAHVDKELIRLRDEDVVTTLKESIEADRQARDGQRDYLKNRNAELESGIESAKADGNVLDQWSREAELADNQRRIAELDDIDRVESMTRDVLVEKNPDIRRKVFDIDDPKPGGGGGGANARSPLDPEELDPQRDPNRRSEPADADSDPRRTPPPDGADAPRGPDTPHGKLATAKTLAKQYGAEAFGTAMTIYNRWTEEKERAAREGQSMSQARVAVLVAADLTDITDYYQGVTGLVNETTTGTSDYIKNRLKYYDQVGLDTSKFSFRAALAVKASIRGTILGTWQGCKALPGIKTAIGASEGIYAIGSSGSDAAREEEHTAFVEEFNRITQSDNRDLALARAKEMEARIRSLYASYQKFDGSLQQIDAEVSAMQKNLQPVSEPLKQREAFVWQVVDAVRKLHGEGNVSHADLFDRLDQSTSQFNAIVRRADETRLAIEAETIELSSARSTYDGLNADFTRESSQHDGSVRTAQGVLRLSEGLDATTSMPDLLESLRSDMTAVQQAESAATEMLDSYREALQYQRRVQTALLDAQASLDRVVTFFRNEAIRADDSGMSRQLSAVASVLNDTKFDTNRLEYRSNRLSALEQQVALIGMITRDLRLPPERGFARFDAEVLTAGESVNSLQRSIASADKTRASAVDALRRLREALQSMKPATVTSTKPVTPSPSGSWQLSTAINREDIDWSAETQETLNMRPWGNGGNFWVSFNSKTGEATATLSFQKATVMGRTENGDLIWACASVSMKGQGHIDLKTGRLELTFQPDEFSALGPKTTSAGEQPRGIVVLSPSETWTLPVFGGGNSSSSVWSENVTRAAAVDALNIDPKRVTARVNGQINVPRGGGSVRVQVGNLREETWTEQPLGYMTLAWPRYVTSYDELRPYRVTHAFLSLWPDIAEAERGTKWKSTGTLTIHDRKYDYQTINHLFFRLRVGRAIVQVRPSIPLRNPETDLPIIFGPYVAGLRDMGLDPPEAE